MFHVHIFSTFAMGVPMEWNLFMLFGLCFLFGEYGDVPLGNLDNPLLIVLLALFGVVMPVVGNLRPDKISFLPSMRYYAGNWATSMWLFRRDTDAEEKFDREIYKVAPIAVEQLTNIYDADTANYILEKGLAFRAMHSHGRALNALFARAADPARRRRLLRARGRGHLRHRHRLELRRRPLPQRAAARCGQGAVHASSRVSCGS